MTRIALLPSEPIRPAMAGIGIRYLELANRLPRPGIDVVLLSAGALDDARACLADPETVELRRFERGRLGALLADCDGAVTQGQLANDLLLECPELPAAVDLYDPFLVENLHYAETLGLDPYRNDHATWVLQLARGDFFLCSCAEQRLFYLGFLAALGRLNPRRVGDDPTLEDLIAEVPFGVPDTLPEPRPLLPERREGERRLLFGGLYDWYDPWPVLDALETLDPDTTLLLVRNPNPGSTPQRLWQDVETRCRDRGLWGARVQAIDWVPAERRYDLLREVDLLVSTHRPSLETELSLRTRFLDALAVGCPVIATRGGGMSRLLAEHDAGWVVPPGDASAVAVAAREILAGGAAVETCARNGLALLERFSWERVLEPLVDFCRAPRVDPTKDDYAFRPPTLTPSDSAGFRVKRWLRRLAS